MLIFTTETFYFILCTPFIISWLFLFLFSKKTRREQLRMSIFFTPVGPIIDNLFYLRDYWMPGSILDFEVASWKIFLESFLFSFVAFGIGSVLYQIIAKKIYAAERLKKPDKLETAAVVFILGFVAYLMSLLGMNSIFSTSIASLAFAVYIIVQRKDLLFPALMSGFLFMTFIFFAYSLIYHSLSNIEQILANISYLYNTSLGARFIFIPVTELVWAFSTGISVGIFYKYISGLAFIRK